MKGAIIGDIIGSRFEFNNVKTDNFKLFTSQNDITDDTICTVAIMDAILSETYDYEKYLLKWCRQYRHPMGGYGASFSMWLNSVEPQPYNSYGNGSAMRVSPIAWAFDNICDVIQEAIRSAAVTHNHPEGKKGAIATAQAIYCLRTKNNQLITFDIEKLYYDVNAEYKQGVFDETCQGTVPVALRIIENSVGFEDAIRMAMLWGGDSDTLGAIVGSMAEALYGIPAGMWEKAEMYLSDEMRNVVNEFYKKFVV